MKFKSIVFTSLVLSSTLFAEETFWDKTKEFGSKTWESTKEYSGKAWDATKEAIEDTDSDDVKDTAKEGYDKTKEVAKDVYESDTVQDGIKAVKEKTQKDEDKDEESFWDKTKKFGSKTWESTKEYSGKAWDATKETYEEATKE